ncbi:MAG: carboxypeptidase regulatory-like domain-containing protein [Bryobacteraceae bacterium]|nr:carboxypeptidase regulatory-like domain-containing protein [Bryobacteraceae bacterium]
MKRLLGVSAICLSFLSFLSGTSAFAQAPTGSIAGTVVDETGAVIPDALIRITNKATGAQRSVNSNARGEYSVSALLAGDYEIRTEAKGFRALVRSAEVTTGTTTNAELRLTVGATAEVMTVEGAAAQISYDSNKIDGVVNRRQIENLPLNGRSFLQLAFLEPGVTVNTASLSQYNAQFSVSVLGGDAGRTAINADGGNIRDRTTGNTSQNISQETVQEFQLSSVNFDLSTGISSVGAVNIVTRNGGNDFHGTGYFYFRDNNMAAYPALRRNPINPEPFFARRQPGVWVSGPIKKDKLFFFANYEFNNQDAVVTVQPNAPSLVGFTDNPASPYTNHQVSARVDWLLNAKNTIFGRFTMDKNKSFGSPGGNPLPSNWLVNSNNSNQSIIGWTATPTAAFVNDFRFSYVYWKNRNLVPTDSDCPASRPGCIGTGGPQITVSGAGFVIGNTQNAPQGRDYDTIQFVNNSTWQKGSHRIKFGGELEKDITEGFWEFCLPACITAWSVEQTQRLTPGITLPAQIRNYNDILELPFLNMTVGYGPGSSPAPFQADKSRINYRMRFYGQDTWRVTPKLTLNYGLAWAAETTLANHDLDKPAYLRPIIGDIGATRRDWNNFAPAGGFAWNPFKSNKTVIRGGAGVYYDTQFLWERLNERNSIGPRGNGRNNVSGNLLTNSIAGIAGVPVGTPLEFIRNPTELRVKHIIQMIPGFQQRLAQLFPQNFDDLSIRGVNLQKTVSGFATIFPTDYPTSYGYHFNIGMQHEIARNLVIQADFVNRQFLRRSFGTTVDANRWDSVEGPVIPRCVGTQATDPLANCSLGPIQVRDPNARSNYRGLLLKADKRFASRWLLTASYAYAVQNSVLIINNKRNFFSAFGEYNPRHVFNLSGVVDLPWGFQVSFISAMSSRPPVNPSVQGGAASDIDGDGTGFEFLPGAGISQFNRGLGRDDLYRLIDDWNATYAGRLALRNPTTCTAAGQAGCTVYSRLSRPRDDFQFGDVFSSQDLRVTKVFNFKERYRLNVFGEVFNVLNVANLGGFNFNLIDPAGFGQPTTRAGQIFGSGGPRAFQLGARLSF